MSIYDIQYKVQELDNIVKVLDKVAFRILYVEFLWRLFGVFICLPVYLT